jgi:hypothetical protein
MKSAINIKEGKYDKVKFPAYYRTKDTKLIVLFMHNCCGMVVDGGTSGFKVGHFAVMWHACTNEDTWEKLGDGTEVTLTQD